MFFRVILSVIGNKLMKLNLIEIKHFIIFEIVYM